MIYDENTERYYTDIEDAAEAYIEDDLDPSKAILYECNPVVPSDHLAEGLADMVIDYIDSNCPQFADEEAEYFSNTIQISAIRELECLIKSWLISKVTTVEPSTNKLDNSELTEAINDYN